MLDYDKQYSLARYEHAFLLRCEGMLYKEIGARLGVSLHRATQLTHGFARIFRRSQDRVKSKIATYVQIEIAQINFERTLLDDREHGLETTLKRFRVPKDYLP